MLAILVGTPVSCWLGRALLVADAMGDLSSGLYVVGLETEYMGMIQSGMQFSQ